MVSPPGDVEQQSPIETALDHLISRSIRLYAYHKTSPPHFGNQRWVRQVTLQSGEQ